MKKIKIDFKIKEEKELKKIFIGVCPVCGREVRGIGKDQVNWNLTLHMNQKHPKYFEEKIKKKRKKKDKNF